MSLNFAFFMIAFNWICRRGLPVPIIEFSSKLLIVDSDDFVKIRPEDFPFSDEVTETPERQRNRSNNGSSPEYSLGPDRDRVVRDGRVSADRVRPVQGSGRGFFSRANANHTDE